MDIIRIVVYGFLLLFITSFAYTWFFGKDITFSNEIMRVDDNDSMDWVQQAVDCRCFGLLKWSEYYWDMPKCIGIKIKCENYEWVGPVMK